MAYAEVAVNAAAPIRQTFTYRIPDGLPVRAGHAVYVPFGSRRLQGVVLEVMDEPAFAEAREIEAIIDPEPVLSPERAQLARWLSDHYLAPLFDCVALMLPPGFKRRPLTVLRPLVSAGELAALTLTDRQRAALTHLIAEGATEQEQLRRALHLRSVTTLVSALLLKGLVERTYELARPQVRPKVVTHLSLVVPAGEALRRASELRREDRPQPLRRAMVLQALAEDGPLPLSELRSRGLTAAVLRDLEADGLATREDVTVVRDPLAGRQYAKRQAPALTAEQDEAYRRIAEALESGGHAQAFLLHGVTGSGKTEVYLQALDKAVALGKRAIVLVPEISLTPQTVRRFGERFPGRVAVMHSGLSLGEHFDVWREVRAGHYDVVVGPRGALFAPQPELGLVVLDEEHEWTYKQREGSPRYHARLAAEQLCRLTGAALVLGSATPDVESHFRAQEGSYRLLELTQRLQRTEAGGVAPSPLPEVEVVDLREELKAGNRSIFSRSLTAGILGALSSKEQVILFLNRRGTASFVQCRDCGHVPACSSCAVSLTLHSFAGEEDRLVCHYCRRSRPVPSQCPECGGARIRPLGLGTERVEEEARRAFPNARTLRWDRDVTRGRDAHERILARFLAHEADILIGTQMVAKGLDMPLVTLVGVISADTALRFPDFRSGERTFQLLEQVAGRAGRGPRGGRVVIQTYSPEHYAVIAAAAHDYHALYAREIEFRRRLGYPPFGRLARLVFAHTNERYAQEQAASMVRHLRGERDRRGLPNLDVLGPAPAFVPRLRGRWRWQVIVRGGDPAELLADAPFPRGWTLDIDPVSLL
ncbi:MAG TPA: primosomal protein N' [Dehalococcoidia bacterium]|nr:primosomal protein N' [Dehalococcoidia bacterium]